MAIALTLAVRISRLLRLSVLTSAALLSSVAVLALRLGTESRISHDRGRFVRAHAAELEAALNEELKEGFNRNRALTGPISPRSPDAKLSPEGELAAGRREHAIASGYLWAGSSLVAVEHYLASARHLLAYVRAHPEGSAVPEALFLVGHDLHSVRQQTPLGSKGDAVWALCLELYPQSIWAARSRQLWQEHRLRAPRPSGARL